MQKAPPQAPTSVAPAGPPPAPAPVFVVQGGPGGGPMALQIPRTARDIEALKARREELSNQLRSVDTRRSKLLSELKQTGENPPPPKS